MHGAVLGRIVGINVFERAAVGDDEEEIVAVKMLFQELARLRAPNPRRARDRSRKVGACRRFGWERCQFLAIPLSCKFSGCKISFSR